MKSGCMKRAPLCERGRNETGPWWEEGMRWWEASRKVLLIHASQAWAASEPPAKLVGMKVIGPHPVMGWESFKNRIFGRRPWFVDPGCGSLIPTVWSSHHGRFQAPGMAALNVKLREAPWDTALGGISTLHSHEMRTTLTAQIKCSCF